MLQSGSIWSPFELDLNLTAMSNPTFADDFWVTFDNTAPAKFLRDSPHSTIQGPPDNVPNVPGRR